MRHCLFALPRRLNCIIQTCHETKQTKSNRRRDPQLASKFSGHIRFRWLRTQRFEGVTSQTVLEE